MGRFTKIYKTGSLPVSNLQNPFWDDRAILNLTFGRFSSHPVSYEHTATHARKLGVPASAGSQPKSALHLIRVFCVIRGHVTVTRSDTLHPTRSDPKFIG